MGLPRTNCRKQSARGLVVVADIGGIGRAPREDSIVNILVGRWDGREGMGDAGYGASFPSVR